MAEWLNLKLMSVCTSYCNELLFINKSTEWCKDCEDCKDNKIHYQTEQWPEVQHNRNYGSYDNYDININYCKTMTVATTDKLCDCRWNHIPSGRGGTGENFFLF